MTLPLKIKRVVLHPDPRLTAPNAEVVEGWDELEPWVRLMWKALRNNWTCGVGLAAPQVGWNARLFIMDTDAREHKPENRRVFWNPEILKREGEPELKKEGCL
jgi:peptide deformylase